MKHVFGPVPSRRLGNSLGIDPIPLKTCNWNCVYCQLGRTAPLTLQRGEYVPRRKLLTEFEQAVAVQQPHEIDWITFVGSGEPVLHSGLGWLIRQVKARTAIPVAVITNGSLLYLPDVRDELLAADVVLPTLDAGNPRLYRLINRAAARFTFRQLIEGLRVFRGMYEGKLWIEIMLIRGMNDTEDSLQEIARILETIKPACVHITLPIRPPTEAWVQPSDAAGLRRAKTILGEIVAVRTPRLPRPKAVREDDLPEAMLSIVTRHPMQESELLAALDRWSPAEVRTLLEELNASGRIQALERNGRLYWRAVATHPPNRNQDNI